MFGRLRPAEELSGRPGSDPPGGVTRGASPRLPLPLSPGVLVISRGHADGEHFHGSSCEKATSLKSSSQRTDMQ